MHKLNYGDTISVILRITYSYAYILVILHYITYWIHYILVGQFFAIKSKTKNIVILTNLKYKEAFSKDFKYI